MFNEYNSLPKINIGVIGNDSVGKKSIIYRYMYPLNFIPREKNHIFKFKHENTTYQVKIYEQSLLSKMARTKHSDFDDPNIDIVLVVYDITDKKSFKDITFEWNNLIQDILFRSHGVVCLVGNKIDLCDKEVVRQSKAMKMCFRFKYMYRRVCGLTGEGVEELFNDMLYWYITTRQRRCVRLINNRLNRNKKEKNSCMN